VAGLEPAGGEPLTLVWLGDSLACGVGAATPEAAFPRKAATLWSAADGRAVHLTCLARPGACTADVLAEQVPVAQELLGPGRAAVVTVGSNDIGSLNHPGRYRRDYAAVLAALAATGATVVAVGLPDMGSAVVMRRPLRTLARWVGGNADRQVRRMAEAHGAHYVHIAVRAPRGTPSHEYLAADRWHPNDETYHRWAEGVAALLTPLLALPPAPAG
jgi:lysophospholipase L1-like esterase